MSHSHSHSRSHRHHHGRSHRKSSGSKPVTHLEVFTSTACRRRSPQPFAGYGLTVPEHTLLVAEPIPGTSQTLHKADIYALHAALELVHGTRARVAVIHHHSAAVAQAYEHKLGSWHAKEWRSESGRPVHNKRVWREIWEMWNVFVDRGVQVTIKLSGRNSTHPMRVAHRLARRGAKMHVVCELCRKAHGRQWVRHRCQPICDLDMCEGRVLKNVHTYMRHVQRRHQRKCRLPGCGATFGVLQDAELRAHELEAHGGRVFACSFCSQAFRSERRVKKHVRNTCREAPFCADCGRLFKSKRELERHNERKTDDLSDLGSASESEEEADMDEPIAEEELGVGDIAPTLTRIPFAAPPLTLPVRSRSGVDLLADDESESESDSGTESDTSTSSSDPEGSAKCRRRISTFDGTRRSSSVGSSGRGSTSGRRVRRAHTYHGGIRSGARRGGSRRLMASARTGRKGTGGLAVVDNRGQGWEINEDGLQPRGSEDPGESVGGSVGRAWNRFGHGSE